MLGYPKRRVNIVINVSYLRINEMSIIGITPAGWADSSKVVVYPSDVDLRDTIEIARQDRDRESARLNSNITRAEGLLAAGMADERTTKALERDRIRAASAQSTLEALTSWESYYGRVFASSGFRVAPSECSLDWALVSVPRKSVNHVSKRRNFKMLLTDIYLLECSSCHILPSSILQFLS